MGLFVNFVFEPVVPLSDVRHRIYPVVRTTVTGKNTERRQPMGEELPVL